MDGKNCHIRRQILTVTLTLEFEFEFEFVNGGRFFHNNI